MQIDNSNSANATQLVKGRFPGSGANGKTPIFLRSSKSGISFTSFPMEYDTPLLLENLTLLSAWKLIPLGRIALASTTKHYEGQCLSTPLVHTHTPTHSINQSSKSFNHNTYAYTSIELVCSLYL